MLDAHSSRCLPTGLVRAKRQVLRMFGSVGRYWSQSDVLPAGPTARTVRVHSHGAAILSDFTATRMLLRRVHIQQTGERRHCSP